MSRLLLALAVLLGSCQSSRSSSGKDGPRVLCVVAHPDDEIAFAGTLYKIATHLNGVCDLAVITNGAGGYKYSTLAEVVYGLKLTDPEIGRSHLPAIRERELTAAAQVLHIDQVLFLRQEDHRNTKDPAEVLAPAARVWDLGAVRRELVRILARGNYDFVFTHLPVPDTHGHHKAATILALEVVAALSRADRPVVLGAYATGRAEETPLPPAVLEGYEITRLLQSAAPFVFDRRQTLGYRGKLDYQIVVNWAIAEHKSQGSFQTLMNRWNKETFAIYALDVPDAVARTSRLFARLAEPQFTTPAYSEEAGATR